MSACLVVTIAGRKQMLLANSPGKATKERQTCRTFWPVRLLGLRCYRCAGSALSLAYHLVGCRLIQHQHKDHKAALDTSMPKQRYRQLVDRGRDWNSRHWSLIPSSWWPIPRGQAWLQTCTPPPGLCSLSLTGMGAHPAAPHSRGKLINASCQQQACVPEGRSCPDVCM